ncbi:MAG TPA: AAC(3) family N-acetyltransferase, partial [Caulobacterales bacterium]|nr:AAC(3) family N-acetyltransferase [Caulobacterales bacterium]
GAFVSNPVPENLVREASPAGLAAAWARAGIAPGDTLLLHSNTLRWTWALKTAGCADPAGLLLESFIAAVGAGGTLLLPLFNFDFTKGAPFDMRATPSRMGALTEAGRRHPRARRTAHPLYSFAAIGARADDFAALTNISGYAENSPFGLLKRLGGKIAALDLDDQSCMTFYHHVEECERADWRYFKDFAGPYTDEAGRTETRTYRLYVRDIERGVKTDLNRCAEALWAAGLYRGERANQGAGLRVIEARRMYDFVAAIIARGEGEGMLYSIDRDAAHA